MSYFVCTHYRSRNPRRKWEVRYRFKFSLSSNIPMLHAIRRRVGLLESNQASKYTLPSSSVHHTATSTVSHATSLRSALYYTFVIILILSIVNLSLAFLIGVSGIQWLKDIFTIVSSGSNTHIRSIRHTTLECGGATCNPRTLVILQTSDGTSSYARMLDCLQSVQLAYASEWGYSYLRWDGIVRGGGRGFQMHHQPQQQEQEKTWLATYNRIYLLHELYHRRRYHWVLFMDPGNLFDCLLSNLLFIKAHATSFSSGSHLLFQHTPIQMPS